MRSTTNSGYELIGFETVEFSDPWNSWLGMEIDENRGDLRVSIENFRSMSEQMDEMVRSNQAKVDTTLTHAALASARFDRMTARLESAAESLELVMKRLEHGQGTLGRLSRDDKLYKELLQTTQNLNDLVRDIRKNPKRYVKIELF